MTRRPIHQAQQEEEQRERDWEQNCEVREVPQWRFDIHHHYEAEGLFSHFKKLEKMMAKIDDDLAALIAAAQDEDTKIDSLIALVGELKTMVDEIVVGSLTPEQQAQLDAAFAAISDNPARIQAAIDANTPAVPEPVEVVE